MKFSHKFRSFTAWLRDKPRTTRYASSIIKKHSLFPKTNLNDILHIKLNESIISNKSWISLTFKEKAERNQVIEVLRGLRKGETLNSTINRLGYTKDLILRHAGKYLKKKGKRWIVSKSDRLQTSMLIYEKDIGINHIIVTNSRDRSIIGKYFANVKKALRSNDSSYLSIFKRIKIKDAYGKSHKFETDLKRIKEIEDSIEEPEFLEIYRDR